MEGDQTQFWSRACYHSFRCCTTVDSSCLASGGYGEKCQTCLSAASPQLIRQPCLQYIGNNGYTREAAMSGKTPYLPTGEPADGRLTWAEWIQSEGVAVSRVCGSMCARALALHNEACSDQSPALPLSPTCFVQFLRTALLTRSQSAFFLPHVWWEVVMLRVWPLSTSH